MTDFKDLTIASFREGVQKKIFTPKEVEDYYRKSISSQNKNLNAYLEVFSEEDSPKKNERGTLFGLPIAVKDNILIYGKKCSAASKILENYRATYDATVIEKLKNEGVSFLGRTNMDEFAMGGSTEHSFFGVTKNPHDVTRVAGGSSGGSAAAVSGGLAIAALGSDTGGSVRQPASFCGVVGLKPTYGTVSRHGLIAMASSLDQVGPITKTVEDAQILFDIISGKDAYDSTCVGKRKGSYKEGKKLAYPENFLKEGIDEDVLKNFHDCLKALSQKGYEIEPITMPYLSYSLAVYYILMPAESSSNLARFDGIRYGLSISGKDHIDGFFKTRREGFGKEVRRRIMLGTYVLSSGYYDAYYQKALSVRRAMQQEFHEVFQKYNGIILPTSPTPSFTIGEKSEDPLQMYLADIFTVSANIVGVPALSVPTGSVLRNGKKLPVGTQLITPWFSEDALFSIGNVIESIYGRGGGI